MIYSHTMYVMRRLLGIDYMDRLMDVAHGQNAVIQNQNLIIESLHNEMQRDSLSTARWGVAMIERFLSIMDGFEDIDEARDVLEQAIQDMREEVSRLEEHVL